jgi:hypothetical protein
LCAALMLIGFSRRNERNFLLRITVLVSNPEIVWRSDAFRQGFVPAI